MLLSEHVFAKEGTEAVAVRRTHDIRRRSPRNLLCCWKSFVSISVFVLPLIFSQRTSRNARIAGPHRRRLSVAARHRAHPTNSNNNHTVLPPANYLDDELFDINSNESVPLHFIRQLADIEAAGPRTSFQSAPLYGSIFDYAYYFVSILVGTPPQRQSVILDSGSSLLGFVCHNCKSCGKGHLDPGFVFEKSSTASWLPCRSPDCVSGQCHGAGGGTCSYHQGYSEGSALEGSYFSDWVALGEVHSKNPFVRFSHLGCHTKETNLFLQQVNLRCVCRIALHCFVVCVSLSSTSKRLL